MEDAQVEDSHDPCSALLAKLCSNLTFLMWLSITEELGRCEEAGLHKHLDECYLICFSWSPQGNFTQVHIVGISMPAPFGSCTLPLVGNCQSSPKGRRKHMLSCRTMEGTVVQTQGDACLSSKGEGYTCLTSTRIQKHCPHQGHLCGILSIANYPDPLLHEKRS